LFKKTENTISSLNKFVLTASKGLLDYTYSVLYTGRLYLLTYYMALAIQLTRIVQKSSSVFEASNFRKPIDEDVKNGGWPR